MIKTHIRMLAASIAFLAHTASPLHAADPEPRHPDIDYLAEAIPEAHANAFHTMKPEEFERRLDELNAIWPDLDKTGSMIELSRLLAGLHDGHALVGDMFPQYNDNFHHLPIQFYEFTDGLFIRSAHESIGELVGAKILAIGGVPAEEALSRIYEIVGHDNIQSRRSRAPYYLAITEVLEHLGLATSTETVTLRIAKDGIVRDVAVTPDNALAARLPHGLVERDDWVDAHSIQGSEVALHLQQPTKDFWYHFDTETGLFYLQVSSFDHPNEFGAQLADLQATLDTIEVEKFVLDIRYNQGGETTLVPPLAKLLMASEDVNREGRFFVLIGRRTFSSGQLLVNALSQYSHAVFIGEPTGASLIFYGNSRPNVRLPSRDITLFLPTKVWMTTQSDDTRLWFAPDLAVSQSSSEYVSNRDPALETAIQFTGVINIRQELTSRLFADSASLDDAVAFYRAYKADPKYRYVETETLINALGYRLLGSERIADAIAILSLNVEDFPESANAFDSLGEAYLAADDLIRARTNYARSLELDPSNDHARQQLADIADKLTAND